MTNIEKHRMEYKLIEQAMNELSQMMQRIGVLESAAEEHRVEADEIRENEMINRKVIEQLKEQLIQEKGKNEATLTDLGRITAERDQLQADLNDVKISMKERTALLIAENEILKSDLTRETDERKNAVELLRKSFTQMQDLMDSVHYAFIEEGSLKP